MWVIFDVCVVRHIGHYVSKTQNEAWCPLSEMSPLSGCKFIHLFWNSCVAFMHSSGLHHTFQWFSSYIISGIEWSSSRPYFDGPCVVCFLYDITFHSVFWTRKVHCVEQHATQMLLTYTPYLPVNGGDSVPKWCASAILDECHCCGLHQSTQCGLPMWMCRQLLWHKKEWIFCQYSYVGSIPFYLLVLVILIFYPIFVDNKYGI